MNSNPAGYVAGDYQPVATNPHPVPAAHGAAAHPRADPIFVIATLGFALLAIAGVAVAAYLVYALGTGAAGIAFVLALVPLAIVLRTIAWIDRWEPEPRAALVFALLWGAAASIAIALIFSFIVQIGQSLAGIDDSYATVFFSAVVQAPLVEEVSKGFGLLLLFWAFRRHFDGPVDGLVYGAMIGVGFAFTENVQYFGLALAGTDLAEVSEIFFLRGILSPFAHVMFTACTGIILGFASRRASGVGAIGYVLIGLVPAIALHAFWNGMAFLVSDFYGYYLAVQVPLFLLGIAFVYFLRRAEQRVTAERLSEYAAAGWFTPDEVAMLSTAAGRARARVWAARHRLGTPFADFTRTATRLAFARQRLIGGRDQIGSQRAEAVLLARITTDRLALAGLPPLPQHPARVP